MKNFLLIAILIFPLTGCIKSADGEKIGNVVKIAQEGIIFSTWEVEIIRGGLNGGGGAFSPIPFDATVKDPKVLEVLQKALDGQKEIKVKYHRETFTMPWTNADHHGQNLFIDEAEIIN